MRRVAELMANRLGWSSSQRAAQEKEASALAAEYQDPDGPGDDDAADGDDAGTSVEAFVDAMKCDSRCVGARWLEARAENYASPPGFSMDHTLGAVMARCGASKLYSHQSAAIDAARSGRSVVVSTPTASGKSLCYVVAIFEAIMVDV